MQLTKQLDTFQAIATNSSENGRVSAANLSHIAITVEEHEGLAEIVCKHCGTKLANLCEAFASISQALRCLFTRGTSTVSQAINLR